MSDFALNVAPMILYELRWSHYCEKIRLALAFCGIKYQALGIDAFRKDAYRGFSRPEYLPNYTVPAIYDTQRQQFVMDSTPILDYLADHYPEAAVLYPGDASNRVAIRQKLIEFDTLLAIPARRFGYSQVILECPDLLPDLFLSHRAGGLFCRSLLRHPVGHFLAIMLSKRFSFWRAEQQGLYEALERYLLNLAQELAQREFVVGATFSAADLALAAQLRPIAIVPFFREHPALASLWQRQAAVLDRYSDEGEFPYQQAIARARLKKPPYRRRIRHHVTGVLPTMRSDGRANNDQQSIWTWDLGLMFWRHWRLWSNKRRLHRADNDWR